MSVVVPAYQSERYIGEAVRSALAQTVTAIEVIVIDDGSTDATAAIVERLAASDSRIRIVRQARGGVSAARNRGLAEARGRWVALLDADDVWLPARLERQLNFLTANPDVAVLGCYGWHIGPDGRRTGVFEVGPRDREHFAHLRNRGDVIFLLVSSVLMDREVARRLGGFREAYRVGQDIELWTRLADHNLILVLPERLVGYRMHEATNSMQQFFTQKETVLLVARNAVLRRTGRDEISLDELRATLRAEPLTARLRRQRVWRGHFWYRKAGLRLAAGDRLGAIWLIGAFALAPEEVVNRLRRQVLPYARSLLARGRRKAGA